VETALTLARQGDDGKGAPASREELDRRLDLRGLIGAEPRFLKTVSGVGYRLEV